MNSTELKPGQEWEVPHRKLLSRTLLHVHHGVGNTREKGDCLTFMDVNGSTTRIRVDSFLKWARKSKAFLVRKTILDTARQERFPW